MSMLVQKNCTACGGTIDDPDSKFCPHCASPLDTGAQSQIDEKNKNVELCPNCGSPVTFNIEKQQFACDFCQTTFATQQENEQANLTYEADDIIPFKVPEGMAKKNFYEWLTKSKHVPLDILQSASNITLEQVYLPYIASSVSYKGVWSADIGYNRQESYTEDETKEREDGTKYTEKVTKTRTVTDWKFLSDTFSGDTWTSYLISEELEPAVQSFVEHVNLAEVIDTVTQFDSHYTAGTQQMKIVPAKVEKSLRDLKEFVNAEAKRTMRRVLPGDEQKNEKMTEFSYEATSKYVYVPFWKITYQYAGKEYSVLGTAYSKKDSKMDGSKPVNQQHSSYAKKLGWYGWISFAVAIVSLIPQFLEVNQTVKTILLPICGVSAVVFLIVLVMYFRFSRSNKQQLKDSLNTHSEYQSLLNKYGNEA